MKVYVLTIKAENVNIYDETRIFDSLEKVQDWLNYYVDVATMRINHDYHYVEDCEVQRCASSPEVDNPFAYWEYQNQYDDEVNIKIEYETLEVE